MAGWTGEAVHVLARMVAQDPVAAALLRARRAAQPRTSEPLQRQKSFSETILLSLYRDKQLVSVHVCERVCRD